MSNKYSKGQIYNILTLADNYGKLHTTCTKTAVGCYLVAENEWRTVISKGANCGKVNCKDVGCLRIEMFGDNSKEHRSTCRCNHSEIDALNNVPENKKHLLQGATAFVTRYPCHNCTHALCEAGVKKIIYGREFPMAEEDVKYLENNGVEVIHIPEWNCDENDNNN